MTIYQEMIHYTVNKKEYLKALLIINTNYSIHHIHAPITTHHYNNRAIERTNRRPRIWLTRGRCRPIRSRSDSAAWATWASDCRTRRPIPCCDTIAMKHLIGRQRSLNSAYKMKAFSSQAYLPTYNFIIRMKNIYHQHQNLTLCSRLVNHWPIKCTTYWSLPKYSITLKLR